MKTEWLNICKVLRTVTIMSGIRRGRGSVTSGVGDSPPATVSVRAVSYKQFSRF